MPKPPFSNDPDAKKPTREELALWERFTHDAQKRPGAKIDWDNAEKPEEPKAVDPLAESMDFSTTPAQESAKKPSGPPANFAGIDRRTARRLSQGQIPIEATLDLHGMSREKAHEALGAFLTRAAEEQKRCILVITGKGRMSVEGSQGVLRKELPHWLELPPCREKVISFTQAKPHHGGDGAFYILLRRRR